MKKDYTSVKLIWIIILNLIITIAEIIGGIACGSLALLSDALHNLSDTGAIILSFIAHRISRKNKSNTKTFGYDRAEIIAAFANGITLIAICIVLFVEALLNLKNPEPIKGNMMLIVSIIGLMANILSMFAVHNDTKKNINIKSTFVHMLSDALSSVVVVIAALIIKFWNWRWIDPVLTILVSIFILIEALKITYKAANILMESNPCIDLEQVKQRILKINEIEHVHHVHLWQYSDKLIMMDAHINVSADMKIEDLENIYVKVGQELLPLGINHITLQAERNRGLNNNMISNNNLD